MAARVTLNAFQPLGTGGTSSPTNLAQAFASPGLSADGAGLYVATGTAVERFVDNNDPTTWTQGATVSSLATYKPSAIGVAPDGSYRMVVSSNQNGLFQEMRSTDGGMTWGSFDAALSSMDLTNDGTLVISSPNLSSDARNLVYLSIDTTLTPPEYTVRFVHRDDARIGFKLATIGGPLLAPRTQRLASPYLSRDCARLYVVIASTAIALFT